jgi:hypothetical protein
MPDPVPYRISTQFIDSTRLLVHTEPSLAPCSIDKRRFEQNRFVPTLNHRRKPEPRPTHYYNRARAKSRRSSAISKKSVNPAWKFALPIFGVWFLLYGSYVLGRPPLPDGPATIHAETAREMLARHDWNNTYANGSPIASPSRLLDWSIAASYRLFGVWDWSARLPIALCVLLLAFTVYFFGRSLFGWNAAGLYAALIVLTWPGTFLATRDLTDAPFLYLETALIASILWQLLIVRNLSLLKAIGISAIACLVIVLTGSWPAIALPLSVLLICWIARLLAAPDEKRRRLLIVWTALAFFLSSPWIYPHFPSRGPLVWLAVIAPLSLIVGGWLANTEAFSSPAPARRIARYLFILGLIVAAIAVFFAIHGPAGFTANKTSAVVTAASDRIPLLVAALAVVVGVSGNLIFRLRNRARIANCFLAGIFGGIIVAFQVSLVMNSPYSSSQILAEAIRPELNSNDIVVIDGPYTDASSLAFYLQRTVSIAAPSAADSAIVTPPAGTVAVNQAWTGPARVFLWTHSDHPLAVPGESFAIAKSGGKEILSNQPNSGGASF